MGQLDSNIHPVVLMVFAIFLPPVAVFLKTRDWLHTLINLGLCFVYVVPGVLHALFFVLRK